MITSKEAIQQLVKFIGKHKVVYKKKQPTVDIVEAEKERDAYMRSILFFRPPRTKNVVADEEIDAIRKEYNARDST